jgi:sugar O-acyltransferase (sialic acid O-acetyltransferase NeuD family)
MKDIVIIGAGDFGKEVAWLIEDINKEKKEWNILGYIDDDEDIQDTEVNGNKVIGRIDSLISMGIVYVCIGLGKPSTKEKIVARLKQFSNVHYANLIHPTVVVAPYVTFGEGNIVCARNVIAPNANIKSFVTINLNCTIGHDVVLKDFVTVAPGVNLSGFVTVGNNTDMGTNCCAVQGLKIGSNTVIGAGSVITKDIPDNCTAVGVPAKPIKFHT